MLGFHLHFFSKIFSFLVISKIDRYSGMNALTVDEIVSTSMFNLDMFYGRPRHLFHMFCIVAKRYIDFSLEKVADFDTGSNDLPLVLTIQIFIF